jgi:hypothetical protein
LTERTEGWPAGLYLAALSLRAGAPTSSEATSFTGDDRYVSEYFRDELLSRLPAEEARFLKYTSTLDAMLGTRARAPTLGFLGWFGPRGLASIVFAVIVVEESNLPHEDLIVLAIYLTVGLSVFVHGLSAAPLAARYARWYEQHPRDKAPPMESAPTAITRARGPAAQHSKAAT